MNHKIVKCYLCGKIIMQCRCPSFNKTIIHDICEKCSKVQLEQKPDITQNPYWMKSGRHG